MKKNKCYLCSSKLKLAKVNIARYWGKQLIALNRVPALVCMQCGERYFEAKVSHKIDQKIALALKEKSSLEKINVPLVQF